MRKLLFDQNLSYRIVNELLTLFPESTHVSNINLDKADDLTVWKYAKSHGYHIISKDSDFNYINSLYGYPPKIIWIHTHNSNTKSIIELLKIKSETIKSFIDNDNLGFLELT